MEGTESTLRLWVDGLRLVVEMAGAAIVAIGFLVAAWGFLRSLLLHRGQNFTGTRLILARYLALALEFQLGADILSTAVAPSWDRIGKLGAIAVIRTGLNYFLSLEMKEESKVREESMADVAVSSP